MRILGTIIVDVLSREAEGSNGGVIGPEFIGCDPGNRRTQLEEPAPYALVGNIQTSLRKKILHIPIAQSEPSIEPNGASNDFRWKAVTFEGDGVHPKRLHRNHQIEIRALNVTMSGSARSGPLTARTDLESCEARERGSVVEGVGQTGFEDARSCETVWR